VGIQKYFSPFFWCRVVLRCLRIIWNGVINILVFAFVTLIRVLPSRARVKIRNKIAFVRKIDYSRTPIYISVDSWIENEFRSREVAKEPDTVEWIENRFKPGDVFYDIGANIGSYSLVTFGFLKGQAKIYSFEPGFLSFSQLCKNININGAARAISPFQVALSDETSVIDLHYQNLDTGGALHSLGGTTGQDGKQVSPALMLPTLSYRLDDFVNQFEIPKPNHVKIDVDGLEFSILQGGAETFKHPDLHSVMVEIDDPGGFERFDRWFEEIGMVLFERRDPNNLYVRKRE
jgi:FkbM family methyltransferase